MPPKHKVLITGSGGMLGTDLACELGEDYETSGIDVVASCQLPVASFECDITNKEAVSEVISKVKPEVVIHTAAYTDVDGCEANRDKAYKINAEGTENTALACETCGAILIYISTDFVFDGKAKKPYNETDKPNPLSVYGDSKLKGEDAVRKACKKYFIIRTSWLYGRNGKNFADTILAKAKSEKLLKVVDDQVGSPTYTKDLAKAIHALLDRIFTMYDVRSTIYGTYHVSNSGSTSWFEYTKEILRLAGSKTDLVPINSEELSRPAKRPAMSVLDNSKFHEFTGYEMREWKDALEEYIKS